MVGCIAWWENPVNNSFSITGINAALKGIDLLLEEGMNVKVLLFPDGDDPDSYSKKVSTQDLKDFIVNNAQNFISVRL